MHHISDIPPRAGEQPLPREPALVRVDLWKGCYLLLTPAEYDRGIKRGKADRRRLAMAKRLEGTGEKP